MVITAFPDFESSFEAGRSGANGYVEGPLFGEDLTDVVRQAIRGSLPARSPRVPADSRSIERQVTTSPTVDARLLAAIRLIDADVSKPWTAELLAASVELHESTFRHRFRARLGVPVHTFVLQKRLQVAAHLLLTSFEHVRQIGYSVGFSDVRNFRSAFRARFGMSPTVYRARFQRLPR